MKKILFLVLFFLLLISCKSNKNGTTSGDPEVIPKEDTTTIEEISFNRLVGSNVNWFYSQYEEKISMWLRENNIAEFYINISSNGNFSEYIAKFSDTLICSFSNNNYVLSLTDGRNKVSVKGNAEGYSILEIYGVNKSGEEFLISGFGENESQTGNKELEVFVYPRDYVDGVIKNSEIDTDDIIDATDILSLVNVGDINLPEVFSLDRKRVGYLAYRASNRYRHQGRCSSCSFFSSIGLLEIETKRQLIYDKNFPISKYDIDLSEAELLMKRHDENKGGWAYNNLDDMKKLEWIIPLEEYNPYPFDENDPNNTPKDCMWDQQIAVNHNSGVKLDGVYRVSGKVVPNFINDKMEVRVKSLLYFYDKAVSVNVMWPELNSDWDVLEGDEPSDGGRHVVNIIGWNNNYVDENGNEYGKVWIAQNSHGKRRAKFYIKMEAPDDAVQQYTYINNVIIEDTTSFFYDIRNGVSVGDTIRKWNDGIPLRFSRTREARASITLGNSSISDMVGYNFVEKFDNFSITRNPKEVFPNISNVLNLSVPQILKNVDLYKVSFKVSRKGTNYSPLFPKTVGIAGLKDNPLFRYCEIISENEENINFATYTLRIGEILDSNGKVIEEEKWIPCKPEDCVIAYTYEEY